MRPRGRALRGGRGPAQPAGAAGSCSLPALYKQCPALPPQGEFDPSMKTGTGNSKGLLDKQDELLCMSCATEHVFGVRYLISFDTEITISSLMFVC